MILKSYEIPHQWRLKLSELQQDFPEAVIAGGCLRDLIHGVDIKDVDIFIPNADKVQADLDDYKLQHSTQIIRQVKRAYDDWDEDVEEVFTLKIGSLTVDVIGVSVEPDQIISRFDFGLCQIQYDGIDVYYTKEFEKDYLTKTFTLLNSDGEDCKRSFKRFKKFKDTKYPNHKLDPGQWSAEYKGHI